MRRLALYPPRQKERKMSRRILLLTLIAGTLAVGAVVYILVGNVGEGPRQKKLTIRRPATNSSKTPLRASRWRCPAIGESSLVATRRVSRPTGRVTPGRR